MPTTTRLSDNTHEHTALGAILTGFGLVAIIGLGVAAGIGLGMPLAWAVDRAMYPAEYGE